MSAESVGPTHPVAAPRRPPARIETPRLLLRTWLDADAPRLAEAIASSQADLLRWTPWVLPEPPELAVLEQRLHDFRGKFESGESFVYGVFDPAETRVLGQAGLYARVGPDALEVGYWIRSDRAGQGYATEAARAMIDVAFSSCGVSRVELKCAVDHAASRAIARRLGFRFKEIVPEDIYHELKVAKALTVFELTSDHHAREKQWTPEGAL